ncbi:MAG: hypothetical protein ACOH5I_03255 [Oligoflexus sp.]
MRNLFVTLFIFSMSMNSLQADILRNRIELNKRPAIQFKPFDYLDPITGKIVSPDTMVELTDELAASFNKKYISARELYEELNKLEKSLNELGYSLRDSADSGFIESALVDGKKLVEQTTKIIDLYRDFDEKIMTIPKEIEQIKNDFFDRQDSLAEKEFTELYEKAVKSIKPSAPVFEDLNEDPNILQVPNRNLGNFVYKKWDVEKGDPNSFLIKALAQLNLSGDFKELEGIFDTRVDVDIFNEVKLNLLYAYLKAGAQDSGDVFISSGLEVAGKKIDRYSVDRKGKLLSWRLSDEKDDNNLDMVFREGESIPFAIGPVPCLLEIGGFGRIYIDNALNASRTSISASAIPGIEAAGYATVAAGVKVAKVGVEGQLVILNSELNIQGGIDMKVPKETGKPELSAFVKGEQNLTALNGNIYLMAGVDLPVVGEKNYRRKLWDWDGVTTQGVLFNFTKTANETGYTLSGAPEPADIDEKNLDNKIKDFFDHVDENLQSVKSEQIAHDVATIQYQQSKVIELARKIADEF